MPRALTVLALFITSLRAYGQHDTTRAMLPKHHFDSSGVQMDLGNWQEGVHPHSPPGVVFHFDYTKFFEWLLPKKKPVIPPDCDPRNMHEWIPDSMMPDTTKFQLPV